MRFHVYLIMAKTRNKYISYVGYTKDINKRILLHNSSKGAKFTKGNKWFVIYKKSYTSKLFSEGSDLISQKVIEELCELIVEFNSNNQNNTRIVEEACDLLFHLIVMISYKNIEFNALSEELEKRKNH